MSSARIASCPFDDLAAQDRAPVSGKGRHRRHANPFSVRTRQPPLHVATHFGRQAPIALDIGCGPGAYVVALAQARPHDNTLGLEIRPHLVEHGRALLAAAGARHADVLLANANQQLGDLLPDNSVVFVSINFPDPWFKKRHHKRRVVTPELLRTLARKMTAEAQVHVMTDYEPLAHAMRQTFAQAGYVDAFAPKTWPTQSTTNIQSEREAWHLSRGDCVWRMRFLPPKGSH